MNHNDTVYISTNKIERDSFANSGSNLAEIFKNTCSKYWERTAFSSFGCSITFSEVYEKATSISAFLQNHPDLKPGDRIILQLPNILQYPIAVYAALQAGLVVVNTNPSYTKRELLHQVRDAGARAIICLDTNLILIKEISAETDLRVIVSTGALDLITPSNQESVMPGSDGKLANAVTEVFHPVQLLDILRDFDLTDFHEIHIDNSNIALLQYTGGTTGISKGAMLTHANLIANANQCNFELANFQGQNQLTFIAPLPLYHVYAFTLHCSLFFFNGDHSVLIADPRNLSTFANDISRWKFDGFVGLNTLFSSLLDNEDFCGLDFSSLKVTFSGGMALQQRVASRWKNVTGCGISEGYGLTEASPAVSFNSADEWEPGSIGRLVVGTECKIIDDNGHPLPHAVAGELCIKGPQVMMGYWMQPQATSSVLSADGWLHTGDIAIMDTNGRLRIVDRKKEMILTSGFNVYPNEIEEVIAQIPEILYCAAVGEPDEKTGEKIVLYIVLKNGYQLSADAVMSHATSKLTGYKRPKTVVFRESLPMSNVGKILRRELRGARTTSLPLNTQI